MIHLGGYNSSYRSYQRFDMQTRRKGQSCIVLTLKPRLYASLNKGIFDSGLNSNNSYCANWHMQLIADRSIVASQMNHYMI